MPITIFLADDHPMIRDGIKGYLALDHNKDVRCVGEAGNVDELEALLPHDLPDVLLLDLNMPGMADPIPLIKSLRERYPTLQILVLTAYEDIELVRRVIGAGARGYLLKDAVRTMLMNAIRQVASGALWLAPKVAHAVTPESAPESPLASLTERELDVLRLIGEGHTPEQIAESLHIAPGTVKVHLKNIYMKLDIHSRTEAILFTHKFL